MFETMQQVGEQWMVYLPRLLSALLVFAAFWLAARLVRGLIRRTSRALNEGRQDVFRLLEQMAHIGLLLIGLITALGTLGVNVSALVASLGLTGFALGFALKDGLSNMVAGVMLLIYRPFTLGDRISVAGNEGEVTAIDLRYTRIETPERTVLIPNASLFTTNVIIHHPDSGQGPYVDE